MKLDLKLLSVHLSRLEDKETISQDGTNDYLLDKILFPCINGEDIYLKDIDFDAFDKDNVEALREFYNKMTAQSAALNAWVKSINKIRPIADTFRAFC